MLCPKLPEKLMSTNHINTSSKKSACEENNAVPVITKEDRAEDEGTSDPYHRMLTENGKACRTQVRHHNRTVSYASLSRE